MTPDPIWTFVLGVYFGGALGTAARVIQEHVTMPPEKREEFREVGRPTFSLVVQTVLWPAFAVVTFLWKLADLSTRGGA